MDFFSLSSCSGHLVDRPSAFHCSIRKELFPLQSKGWDVSMASSRVDVLEGAGAEEEAWINGHSGVVEFTGIVALVVEEVAEVS